MIWNLLAIVYAPGTKCNLLVVRSRHLMNGPMRALVVVAAGIGQHFVQLLKPPKKLVAIQNYYYNYLGTPYNNTEGSI